MIEIKNTAFGRECNVPWESMQELEPGCRFCAHCSREIRDFSKLSRQEVKTLFKENQDLCGVFDIHQFAYEVKLPSPKWLMGMLIPVWLMAEPEVNGQNLVQRETIQSTSSSGEKVRTEVEVSIKILNEQRIEGNIIDDFGRRKIYFTKRFPFFHIRRKVKLAGIIDH